MVLVFEKRLYYQPLYRLLTPGVKAGGFSVANCARFVVDGT